MGTGGTGEAFGGAWRGPWVSGGFTALGTVMQLV